MIFFIGSFYIPPPKLLSLAWFLVRLKIFLCVLLKYFGILLFMVNTFFHLHFLYFERLFKNLNVFRIVLSFHKFSPEYYLGMCVFFEVFSIETEQKDVFKYL